LWILGSPGDLIVLEVEGTQLWTAFAEVLYIFEACEVVVFQGDGGQGIR
jgi:hypothetical protein